MTFKEVVDNLMMINCDSCRYLKIHHADALLDYTAFLDAIPDNNKEDVVDRLCSEIYAYDGEEWKQTNKQNI
jgi:hypothetical protein